MNVLAVVIACGKEEELDSGAEVGFLTLGNMPVLAHSLKTLEGTSAVDGVILAVSKSRVDAALHLIRRYGFSKIKGVVVGGANRVSTLKTVFSKIPNSPSVMLLHEASRPFTTKDVFDGAVKSAKRYGCAVAAHRLPDAVKVVPKGRKANATLDRHTAWRAETPQAFKIDLLEKIVKNKALKVVDDESEFIRKPAEVHMVESGPLNLKIRNSDDLAIASAYINAKLV
ncbi:MAG: 2-C-methyl-D-erythritol 4-phosphate cytidylyltransferase [Pontiellaceae bacterium]|nr:2-C-methyl-D-erythritol 4-phosphate cytidylyltransferase [Pontiellaceae bacterium]